MNSKLLAPTYIAVLVGLAIILCLRSPAAPGQAESKPAIVLVKAGKWVDLTNLQSQAEALLGAKTDFKRESLAPTAWISAGDPEELVKFHYGTGIGHPFWSVSFGSNGTPSFYEHGIAGEGARNPPRDYEKVRVK